MTPERSHRPRSGFCLCDFWEKRYENNNGITESEKSRKGYAWYVITLGKRTLNLTTIRGNTLFGQIWSQNSKLFV